MITVTDDCWCCCIISRALSSPFQSAVTRMEFLLKFLMILITCDGVKSSEHCSNLKKKSSCLASDRCTWQQLKQQCKPTDYHPQIQLCEVCQAPTTTTTVTTTTTTKGTKLMFFTIQCTTLVGHLSHT